MSRALVLLALGVLSADAHAHAHDHEHEHGHDCIHDEIMGDITPVPVHQEYEGHPFEAAASKNGHFNTLQTMSYTSSNFNPIRLFLDTSALTDSSDEGLCRYSGQTYIDRSGNLQGTCGSQHVLTDEKLQFLKQVILPAAEDFYTRALRVVPISGNLQLDTSRMYQQKCMYRSVPSSHQSGSGVGAFDFALYITAWPTQGNTIAWAGSCATDQYDRPIAGQANFGPNQITVTDDPAMIAIQVSTAIHEIAHALGFSGSFFNKFRDSAGNTRTNVVQTFSERGSTVNKITSPMVVEKAREHFGCSTLNGVEIENAGGSGTAGSHFEKRVYMNDFMTGTSSKDPVYSPISLALFEDMGWYRVDYAAAGALTWGKDQGCTFATDYCSNWPQSAKDQGMFCNAAGAKGCTGSLSQFKGYCNLATYGGSLPSNNQYFSDSTRGGNDQLADYCPYVSAYSNGDCRDSANAPSNNYYGESFVPESRCFMHSLLQTGYVHDGDVTTGCYTTRCVTSGGSVTLYVTAGGVEKACPQNGGSVSFSGLQGSLTCPPATDICQTTTSVESCPSSCNARGTCSDGVCQCQTGWTGASCSESVSAPTPTPQPTISDSPGAVCSSSDPNACNGHGTCSALTCTCEVGWTGDLCETEDATHTQLTSGVAVTASAAKDEYTYFRSASRISASQEVTVVTTPSSGDPDVYVSFSLEKPTRGTGNYLTSGASGGAGSAETITITKDTAGRNTVDAYFYIGVLGYSATSFDIEITVTSSTCVAATTCSGKGTCSSGSCVCSSGWSGADCATPDCPGAPDCGGHGTCSVSGSSVECTCNSGYSGSACETFTASNDGVEIPAQGGSRDISGIALGNWAYYSYELNSGSLPSRLAISFSRPSCTDSSTYRDAVYNDLCSSWVGYNCADRNMNAAQQAELKSNCQVACTQCLSNGALMMARFNAQPTMSGNSYTADYIDQESWQTKDGKADINLINLSGSGTLWIGVYNHPNGNGDLVGTLTVTPTSASALVAACNPAVTCNAHGTCSEGGECVCDETYHGIDCASRIQDVAATSTGTLGGKEYAFFYYEVTDEEAFTVNLAVTPVASEGRTMANGTAGRVKPRLFVRRAPNLPVADQLAFTDYDGAMANAKDLSVRVESASSGSGLWYIGVLNAAGEGVDMDFSVAVEPLRKNGRITQHCDTWRSETCNDDPSFTCPAGSTINKVKLFDYWFNDTVSPFLGALVKESTCDPIESVIDAHTDFGIYEFCHERWCPAVASCIGEEACTVASCVTPTYFQDLCYSNRGAIDFPCGAKMVYTCLADVADLCGTQNPCGAKGVCADNNGLAVCECQEGWQGADCKTPPPYQASLGTSDAALMTEEEAWTVTTVEPTTEAEEPTTEAEEPTTEAEEPTTEDEEPTAAEDEEPTAQVLSAAPAAGPVAALLAAASLSLLF